MSDAALIDFLTPRIVHAVKTDLTASVGIKANWSKESSVRSCFEALQISWPENLLETLSAPSPPSLDFWRSLPGVYNIGDLKDRWVKYAVLLEHPDKGPLVYFGIAAGGRTGADPRIKQYKTGKNMAYNVANALRSGYCISHHGALAWSDKPPYNDRRYLRNFFLALEGYFSFAFWTMSGRTEYGYGMLSVSLWSLDAHEYRGACSHSAMMEGASDVRGEDLTEEEIAVHEAAARKHYLDMKRLNYRDSIARMTEEEKAEKRVAEAAKQKRRRDKMDDDEHDEYRRYMNNWTAEDAEENIAAAKYVCTFQGCPRQKNGQPFNNAGNLSQHMKQHEDKSDWPKCKNAHKGCKKVSAQNIKSHEKNCKF